MAEPRSRRGDPLESLASEPDAEPPEVVETPAVEPEPEPEPAPLETRVLLLPVRADRETIDYFGLPLAAVQVLINYHDLAKVRVTATAAVLADLVSRARAHFTGG